MPDIVVTTAGDTGTSPAAAVTVTPGQLSTPSPEQRTTTAEAIVEKQPLAEVIRERRAAREAASRESTRAQTLEARVKELQEQLEAARSATSEFEDDPVGYAKSKKWTPEQQLLYGKSLMFDLVPEKADPDFRIKMFEDRQRREEKRRETEAKDREKSREVEQRNQYINHFYAETQSAVKGFQAGSFPESEAWFGEDVDAYMQSIMATAANLSSSANQEGRVADLSPATLAAALEAEVARRMTVRDQRRAAKPKTEAVTPAKAHGSGGEQSAETVSTKDMNGGSAPLPPPRSDKERVQRAIAAGWRSR